MKKTESGWEIVVEEYKMELFAPDGFRFEPGRGGFHSFVEWRHRELSDAKVRARLLARAKTATLYKCEDDCDCMA